MMDLRGGWTWLPLVILTATVVGVFGATKPVIPLSPSLTLDEIDNYLQTLKRVDLSEGSECFRPCVKGVNRLCYQKWHVEEYQEMGAACGNCSGGNIADCNRPQCVAADGFERGILSINRQIPGPMIEVCQNDLIVIDVVNALHSESVTIHWHGFLQLKTPYMDGVPFLTQCPIHPSTLFRYKTYALEEGTFFYHSHSGIQRFNGIFGPLIVRVPLASDKLAPYYDHDLSDHTVVISDWLHQAANNFAVGLPTLQPGSLPDSLLINGMGRYYVNPTTYQARTPYKTFYVQQGKRYRFRIVNAGSSTCVSQVQVQSHTMLVVATDGSPVKPLRANTIFSHTGERVDVIIDANQPPGVYWIFFKLVGLCTDRNIFQHAILSYIPNSGNNDVTPPVPYNPDGYPRGVVMSDTELSCSNDPNNVCIAEMKGLVPTDLLTRKPDKKFYLSFGMIQMTNSRVFTQGRYTPFINFFNDAVFLGTVNGIASRPPDYPVLTQGAYNSPALFCDGENIPPYCADEEVCVCSHFLHVQQGALVEMVLFDVSPGGPNEVVHPIHWHGFRVKVKSQGRVPGQEPLTLAQIKQMEARGELNGTNKDPPTKDTVCIQNHGFTVIRFIADNPGCWNVHCHVEDHMVFGMHFVVCVSGLLPKAPAHFPTCGNFPPISYPI